MASEAEKANKNISHVHSSCLALATCYISHTRTRNILHLYIFLFSFILYSDKCFKDHTSAHRTHNIL